MNPNTVVLVEIGGSHDECLLTQMHALKKHGREIALICTENIKNRNPEFRKYVNQFYTVDLSLGKIQNYREMLNIWKVLRKSGVKTVVFNTAQGNHVRILCLLALFNKIDFIGIVHTTLKFKKSFTQRIINLKIKKYFLLSKYLLSTIKPPRGISIDYFHPIRFPHYEKSIQKKGAIITIIGGVENRRSDLPGFVDMLVSTKEMDITFVFLGPTNLHDEQTLNFKNDIKNHGLDKKVIMFDDFVSQETFDAYLQITDLILPLIHPHTTSGKQYFRNQISGAMSIAFGYKIPLLLHKDYSSISEMQPASFYYDENNFLSTLKTSLIDREEKSRAMASYEDFNVDHHENRYLNFIFPDEATAHPAQTNPVTYEGKTEHDVSVILINYNSSTYTLECVQSILLNTDDSINFQIVIIDNASARDDYINLLTGLKKLGSDKRIHHFRSRINLGFSGGNMLGVQFSSARYYFFLNNDCTLINDCLSILFDFCNNNDEAALCSPQLYNNDGSHQPCFGYFPYLVTKLFSHAILKITYGNRYIKRKDIYNEPVRVDVVSGSQMFVRSSAFNEIGGFDTTFFLYSEEEDIAIQLHHSGYSTYLVPDAKNTHVGGASTSHSLDIKKEFYISFLYFYRKHFGLLKTQALKALLTLRLIRRSFKEIDNLKLSWFVASGANFKHSLKHKQRILDETQY